MHALRIAVVTETYPPEVNGVARTLGLMVQALLQRGHDVQLVRPRQRMEHAEVRSDHFRECLTLGVPIPCYASLQAGIASVGRLKREWQRWRPDVVQIATEGPLGWAAERAARKLGISVATDFHTNFHAYSHDYGIGGLAGLVERYLRAFHNRAACTMVPSSQMKCDLEAIGFKRLQVVGRGIDSELFSPARRSDALRHAWGCGPETLVVAHVGRLAPEKNLPLFFKAADAMRPRNVDLRILLVGDGPQASALRKSRPDCVFAGVRTGEDLAAHYASADVFLFPSLTETFGNVTVEAMASGLAVVAFDYAAARECIVHMESGLLTPMRDEIRFTTAAVRVASDPWLRTRLRTAAREAAEALSWDRSFDELERVLFQVADGANSGNQAHDRRSTAMTPENAL